MPQPKGHHFSRYFQRGAGLRGVRDTWRKFQGLSAASRQVVIEAAAALAATSIGLRIAGYAHWNRVLKRLVPETSSRLGLSAADLVTMARAIARLEESAARHLMIRASCLEKSLVLCWLLQRRGIEAKMRIGGRKENGTFEAHAWVELYGQVLNDVDGQHRHFSRFGERQIVLNTELS